jgi:hypothetical protein
MFNERLERMRSELNNNGKDDEEIDALAFCLAEVEALQQSSGQVVEGGLASGVFEDFFCATSEVLDRVIAEYKAVYS